MALGLPTPTPNFSGIWIMDLDRSTFQSPNPPVSVRYVISQSTNRIRIWRTDVFPDGTSSQWSLDVSLNGSATVLHPFPFLTRLTASWKQKTLLLQDTTTFPGGSTSALLISYELIERGRTLFSQEQRRISRKVTTNKLYFVRR
jgi:hypothetical protein